MRSASAAIFLVALVACAPAIDPASAALQPVKLKWVPPKANFPAHYSAMGMSVTVVPPKGERPKPVDYPLPTIESIDGVPPAIAAGLVVMAPGTRTVVVSFAVEGRVERWSIRQRFHANVLYKLVVTTARDGFEPRVWCDSFLEPAPKAQRPAWSEMDCGKPESSSRLD